VGFASFEKMKEPGNSDVRMPIGLTRTGAARRYGEEIVEFMMDYTSRWMDRHLVSLGRWQFTGKSQRRNLIFGMKHHTSDVPV